MRIIVLPVGRCRFLEENESGLRFRRNKTWRFTECTTPYNRPSVIGGRQKTTQIRRQIEQTPLQIGIPSLRSWRCCKRTRNKVLVAEPTSERRGREENGERDFEIPPVFLAASPLASRSSTTKTLIPRAPYRQLRRLRNSQSKLA